MISLFLVIKLMNFSFVILKNCSTAMWKGKRTEIEILLSVSACARKRKKVCRNLEKENEQQEFEKNVENLIIDNWRVVPVGVLNCDAVRTKIWYSNYRVVGRNVQYSDFLAFVFRRWVLGIVEKCCGHSISYYSSQNIDHR